MPNHVTEWLNAYLDGELQNGRLHMVKAHLVECKTCQAELRSLQDLSELLHKVPQPEFTSPERFATQVNLLLPQKPVATPRNRLLELGWWLIPIGLLAAWTFISTAGIVSNLFSAANNFGLLDSTAAWLVSGSSESANWTSTLGQFSLLEGNGLQWFRVTESYSRNVIPQFVWQVSIAVLYLAWMAVWWARRTNQQRQGDGQLFEG